MKKPTRKNEAKKPSEEKSIDSKLSRLAAAFASDPRVTSGGKGFGSGALKASGKIFAMISSRGQFVVKLPKERVAELVREGRGEYFDPGHGKLMKEWFAQDGKPNTWLALAKEAHCFVLGEST